MANRKKIVFFYSEVMPYNLALFRSLVVDFGYVVEVVYWDKKKLTPFFPAPIAGVKWHRRSTLSATDLIQIGESSDSGVVYVSGRMDGGYLRACRILKKKKNIKIVSGSDNQYNGSVLDVLRIVFSYWLYRRYFDFLWVPGCFQYEFARKVGFPRKKIINDLLAADLRMFENISNELAKTPGLFRILYIGRFHRDKGIDLLVTALDLLHKEEKIAVELLMIGNGPERSEIPKRPWIEVVDFLAQKDLITYIGKSDVFCLPSRREPWGVVLHEMAAGGMPIICSRECGAAVSFVKNGYNGYVFETGNTRSLKNRLVDFCRLTDEERVAMGRRSRELARAITPRSSAASLVSLIKQTCVE